MPEIVRVAITDNSVNIAWPPRCPRCGEEKRLVPSTNRVSRLKSVRPNLGGGLTMRSDVMYMSVPMCERHAGTNRLANLILQRSPLWAGLRALSWLGLAMLVSVLVGLILHGGFGNIADMGAFLLLPLIGIVGGLAIWWARKNTSVWPKRFDPDMDVLEIQFANERYARHFRRANRDATDSQLTAPPLWYMRSLLWKIVAVVVLIIWLARLTTHH